MIDWIARLVRDLRNFVVSLPPGQRVSFVGAVGLLIATSAGLWLWVQKPQFQTLFSNLDGDDASSIVTYLKEERIPYRISAAGGRVEVPAEQVLETRLALAGRGLPQGGGVGFEIFDKQTLGMTDFVQRLNFQRALQGELGRSITQLRQVEGARVHLVLPERALFSADQAPPGASVILKLKGGMGLKKPQIRGIAHLVAASVQGLDADDVTIVDTNGNLLSGSTRGRKGEMEEPGILAFRRTLESDYERRVESMLERVLGKGKVIARVTAKLDLTRVEKTEVVYDPDGAVVGSEKRVKETTTGEAANAGIPGVASNITNQPDAQLAQTGGPRSEHENEAISYEVSRTTSHITEPMGSIERLSVAVLIDGTYTEKEGERTFVPRPPEEIERFRELVKKAVGFDEKRGDEIEVSSAPFEVPPAVEVEETGWRETVKQWSPLAYRLGGAMGLLLVIMFVVRPFLIAIARRPAVVARAPAAQAKLGVAPQLAQLAGAAEGEEAETLEYARRHPDRTAQLIKHWMIEHGGNR